MNIDTLVKYLGKDMGLTNLCLGKDACCTLKFDDKYMVVIEAPENDDRIYIYSMIYKIPGTQKSTYYEMLLEANLFGKLTGKSWFACNAETDETFLISAALKESLNYDNFVELLEAFLERLEFWTDKLGHTKYPLDQELGKATMPPLAQLHNPFV